MDNSEACVISIPLTAFAKFKPKLKLTQKFNRKAQTRGLSWTPQITSTYTYMDIPFYFRRPINIVKLREKEDR